MLSRLQTVPMRASLRSKVVDLREKLGVSENSARPFDIAVINATITRFAGRKALYLSKLLEALKPHKFRREIQAARAMQELDRAE